MIAPFEDGNSYRAMVHKVENGKAKIIYIDFGNIDEVDIKDLKVMPQCHSLVLINNIFACTIKNTRYHIEYQDIMSICF